MNAVGILSSILSPTAAIGKNRKGLKPLKKWPTFSNLDALYSNNPQNLNMDSFSWKNSFDVVFLEGMLLLLNRYQGPNFFFQPVMI